MATPKRRALGGLPGGAPLRVAAVKLRAALWLLLVGNFTGPLEAKEPAAKLRRRGPSNSNTLVSCRLKTSWLLISTLEMQELGIAWPSTGVEGLRHLQPC